MGTVVDPTGAAVPNVKITITQTETGRVRTINTNAEGQFLVADLLIGRYNIRAEAQGFKSAERLDLKLNAGDRARLDFKLEIGNTKDSIQVEATAIAVQAESGEVSDVVSGTQVSQLAANGRSIYSLMALTPGASGNMPDFQSATPVGGNSTVSFNGRRQSHNLYMVDGGENYDRGGSGNISIMPSIEAIAEFRTLTSNYSAEYGLSSAATITMVFKSGSRDLHATAWEFLRNDALDAGNFFTNRAGKPKPELRSNTYGFNIGGPVTFGKAYNKDRNRSFFFYNMEWRKLVQGGNVNQTVPDPGLFNGVFPSSQIIHSPDAGKISSSIQNQYTSRGLALGAPFPNNTIPAAMLDTNAQTLLKAGIFPAPNSGTNFVGGNKQPTNVREEIVRADHQFSDKFSVFGHWVTEAISQTYGTAMWSGDNVPTVGNTFNNPSYSGVVHATHSISPTLLNEVAFNYNGNRIAIEPKGLIARPSGLAIPELFAGNNSNRIPSIALGQLGTNFDISSWPWHNKADDYQVRDDLSWTFGRHQLRMGASWALYKKTQDLFGQTQGSFNFNGAYTGSDLADMLLGYANTYTELAVQDNGNWNNVSWAAYVQDNWRVNKRLTLNLGLRWDGAPHTYEANNRMSNFYPNLYDKSKAAILLPGGNAIDPASPGLGTSPNALLQGMKFYLNGMGISGQTAPKGLVDDQWFTFGPRVGFAYDVTGQGKTVLRGGFGIMYERIQGNDMYNAGPNIPFSSSVTFNNVSLSNPNLSLATGQALVAPITLAGITGLAGNDYKMPISYQYSFGVQRELMRNTVLTVSYVGNQNRHQNGYRDINLPAPSNLAGIINKTVTYNAVLPYLGYQGIRMSENAQNSHYNSMQVSLRAEPSRDLTLQFAYTLSRSIDPATGGGSSGDLANLSNPYDRSYDVGRSGLDRTHVALLNFVYTLPILNSAHTSRMVRSTLGGWSVSGVVTMETGLPLWITLGGAQGSNGLANGTNRPNFSGTVSYPKTIDQWFDKSAFSSPTVGAWGNLKKGDIIGPGRHNWNLALFKRFAFNADGARNFELRIETFNTFNHTQFNGIQTSFANGTFGSVTSTWDPRSFQIGAKLHF